MYVVDPSPARPIASQGPGPTLRYLVSRNMVAISAFWDVKLSSELADNHPREDGLYSTGQTSNLYRGASKLDLLEEIERISALASAK